MNNRVAEVMRILATAPAFSWEARDGNVIYMIRADALVCALEKLSELVEADTINRERAFQQKQVGAAKESGHLIIGITEIGSAA